MVLLALGMAAPQARAGLFDDEEARKRIEATNQRLAQVQRQLEDRLAAIEAKMSGVVDLGNQMELLRGDLAKMRGQIEVLSYELEQAQKRQRDLYVDLDTRLRKIESPPGAAAPADAPASANLSPASGATSPAGPAPPAGSVGGALAPAGRPGAASGPPTGAAPAPPTDAAAEQRAYDAALDQFKRGDYPGSISAFSAFVKAYPKSALAPSAQYWVGNAHYARRDFRGAIAAQRTLISTYPDSSKVPDALLNIASAQAELGEAATSRRTLEELVAKHPQSEAAQKARQRLAAR
jgi:tol-pal system protein YbgF